MSKEIEITKEILEASIPNGKTRKLVTEDIVKAINAGFEGDVDTLNVFKENFLSYSHVLKNSNYDMNDYINAIKFTSLKLLGRSDTDAYIAVFPDRYQRLVKSNRATQVSGYANSYKHNVLVQQLLKQTLVPSYILNAPLFQEALNELAKIMTSEKVGAMAKVKAAEAILEHTKAPEENKIQLDIGINQIDAISDLRSATENLLKAQREALKNGKMSLQEIAESTIIEVTQE